MVWALALASRCSITWASRCSVCSISHLPCCQLSAAAVHFRTLWLAQVLRLTIAVHRWQRWEVALIRRCLCPCLALQIALDVSAVGELNARQNELRQ